MRTASLSALALAATAAAQEAPVPPGQQTFQVVCATCHSINPPANKAPPMAHVMGYYRRAFKTEDEAVEAIVQWVQRPDSARSKLPAHALQRFGLMPAFPLPEAQLREVARYVWTLGSAPTEGPRPEHAATHRPPR